MLKKYCLLVSITYSVILTILSLVKIGIDAPSLPSNTDKVGHFLAHFIFVILWFIVFKYKFKFNYIKAILYSAICSIVYGLLIELLQGLALVSRQSDVNDVIANTIGMVFAVLLLLSIRKRVLKNNNTLLF